MSQDDEGSRRSHRAPKRTRVTLNMAALPLRLPGEASGDSLPIDSAELALPTDASADEEPERASSNPPEPRPGVDAWERQRPRLTPPPFRPPGAGVSALGADEGGALDLVDRRARASPSNDLAVEMSDRYALGDYTAALRSAELILGRDAAHEAAQRIAESCRERLEQLFRSRLGPLRRVPVVAVEGAEVRWLGLDHRAGFLLSRVDGSHTLAEIVDMSGMPRVEALRTLVELVDLGALRLNR